MQFTLIDRILGLESGRRIVAIKNLTLAEEYLAEHFPGFPVMPGVLMLEAIAQASAWLIRHFIDPKAVFAFVDKPVESDVAFDMYAGGFGHRGGLCTFEVLCEEFGIATAPVTRIAQIVHDLDLKENTYGAPEAAVISRLIDGLRAVHADDATLLEQGIGMFDALARSFEMK